MTFSFGDNVRLGRKRCIYIGQRKYYGHCILYRTKAKSEVGTKAKDKPQSKSGPSRDVPKEQEQGMVMPGSLRSPPGKSGTVPAVKEAGR